MRKKNTPVNKLPDGVPLWCVYGSHAFPSIIVCVLIRHPGDEQVIWGYSVYKREPGYRTLGVNLKDWLKRETYEKATFFQEQQDAITYLTKIVTPKV